LAYPKLKCLLLVLYCIKMEFNQGKILAINTQTEFEEMTMAVFQFQTKQNAVYQKYIQALKININSITQINQIPFLPIEFFKTHEIISSLNKATHIFTSSGTTGTIQSKHFVSDVSVYEKSYTKAFELFYGDIKQYCFLALLPSYLERDGSSLVYMANDLIKQSEHPKSGFYLNNTDELIKTLEVLYQKKQKVILLGVTYALIDLAEKIKNDNIDTSIFQNCIVMETGGMKGKRKEMVKEEIHRILKTAFQVSAIHSEYGMTELLSQAYSKGNGLFIAPPWMKIMIRDVNDPFTYLNENKTGGINVIDLANINSCSFIATQDLGKIHPDGTFEILGRFDNSDIRGCNLLVQ